MLDPFPPPPDWLRSLIEPWALYFNLPGISEHIHEILIAFAFYQFIHSYLSPRLSSWLLPRFYNNFNRRTKLNWDVHVVSLVQSTLINALALWVMFTDQERKSMTSSERVYGYTGGCGLILALATGYFVYDLIISTVYMKIFGVGMFFHGLSALWVFSLGFVSSNTIYFFLITSNKTSNAHPDTLCQLLLANIHPLRAFEPIPQHPLVPRQGQHDRQPRTVV